MKERAMNLIWLAEHSSKLLLTAVATHLLMSFSQTVMHYRLGHRRLGGIFFRNHLDFHHVYYSKDHLASLSYIKNDGDGNNTPFLLIPVTLIVLPTYFILSFGAFITQIITVFASFLAHVYLDNQYHTSGSMLLRFAWFRRKQQLHFVHHIYGDSNFALIDNFWDKLLGTYRNPDADSVEAGISILAADRWLGPRPVSPPRHDLPCTPSTVQMRRGNTYIDMDEADRSSALAAEKTGPAIGRDAWNKDTGPCPKNITSSRSV
jgi:sterol desaturase/sphingolipid hydroxylase (fatty acid hydroxylase superfamily)